MKKWYTSVMHAFLFLTFSFCYSQVKNVTGIVLDGSQNPIPGVSVFVEGGQGVVTDFDGNYSITAEPAQTLVFTYLGYTTQRIQVGEQTTMNVVLVEDMQSLNEVVITAYGTTNKETSSVSISNISSENITSRPNANVLQALQGQAAGVNIVASTGQPGAAPTVRIRGVGTINGSAEPLYVIDGIPTDANAFRSLNSNDISSVSVLKDAGATAIYGNRGANGVIIITTSKGSYNSKLKVNLTSRLQVSNLPTPDYDLLNSQEQLLLERTFGELTGDIVGRGSTYTDEEIAAAPNTDWTDVFFRTALSTNHNLSLSSGGENVKQFTSVGYLESEGILNSSDLQRINLRSSVDGKSSNNKFKYGVSLGTNFSRSNEPNNIGTTGVNRNPILAAYQSLPYISPEDYVDGASLVDQAIFANTPLFLLDLQETRERRDDEIQLLGSLNASYEIAKGLTAKVELSSEYRNEEFFAIEDPNSFNALIFAGGKDPSGTQTVATTSQFIFNQVTSLNYKKTFDKNTIDAGVFMEYNKGHYRQYGFAAEGLNSLTLAPFDDAGFIDDNADDDVFVDDIFANSLESGLFSYFTKVDYDYDKRFGFTGTLRRDASYRFATTNRWGTFYSLSGRWNISNESFMDNSIFDVLKLRASYGTTGNQVVDNDLNIRGTLFDGATLSRDLLTTGTAYNAQNAIFAEQIGNADLEWEISKQLNIGLDFEVFNSRLRGSLDGYIKDTENLFLNTPLSAASAISTRGGFFQTTLDSNAGEIRNSGIDLSLAIDAIRSNDVDGFNLTFNITGNYNKNEIINLDSESGEIILGTTTSLKEGGSIGDIYTYRYVGVNQENGNLVFLTADGETTEDPDIDADRVFLDKNIYPDFEGGFGFDIDYKGIFVNTQFRYAIGIDRFDNDLQGFEDPGNIGNFTSSSTLLNAWTPTNTNTDIPSLTASNIALSAGSDRYVTSADYLRLRFAQIGYSIPNRYIKDTVFNYVKIYASGENLLTFTDWLGFDPEVIDINSQTDSNEYPSATTYAVGVELGF